MGKKLVADIHLHSKYSMATSQKMNPIDMAKEAKKKGIDILATGDITHPKYVEELKAVLEDNENGLYDCKGVSFMLCGEISNVFSDGKNIYKIHQCFAFKSFDEVEQFQDVISKHGELGSDGRPVLDMSAAETVEIAKSIAEDCFVFPAHIWTPWFSLYGSKSGFNSIKDCYQDMVKHIKCAETGLSSDPKMNWRVEELDRINLISNSDSHSLEKMGREANVVELEDLSYKELIRALETGEHFVETIEFYPEEGKYHFDGHRKCGVSLHPAQTRKYRNICPVCKRPLTVGVLNRVEQLATREEGYIKPNAIPFRSIVPLREIVSQYLGVVATSTKVSNLVEKMLSLIGTEFYILLDCPYEVIEKSFDSKLASMIYGARIGNIKLTPGYDGVYGRVEVIPASPTSNQNVSYAWDFSDTKQHTLKDFF